MRPSHLVLRARHGSQERHRSVERLAVGVGLVGSGEGGLVVSVSATDGILGAG